MGKRKAKTTLQDIEADTAEQKRVFIEVFRKTDCNVSLAAEKAGVHRRQVYRWMDDDPEFKTAFENERERIIDHVESALMKNIQAGKEASIFFFLKCRAKDRGYIERQELTGRDGKDLYQAPDFSKLTVEEQRQAQALLRKAKLAERVTLQ